MEDPGHCLGAGAQGVLAFIELREGGLGLNITADLCMTGVATGEQHAARRGADRGAAVVTGEAHALRSQSVEMGRRDLLLTVAAQLGPTEVVGEHEHHIEGLSLGGGFCGGGVRQQEDRQDCEGLQPFEPEGRGGAEVSPHR